MVSADDTVKVEPTQGGDSDVALSADAAAPSAETAPADDAPVDQEEYARLLSLYDSSFRNIAEGEVIKGTVLKVSSSEVIVDVGYKSEGMISLDEFRDEHGEVMVQEGDLVDVLLERTEDRDGHIVLSREKAEKMKIWDEVEKAYDDRKVVIGRVIERIKGGLAVDIGVRAFLPGSQVDVRPVRNLDALRGQELRMRVIKVNKKRGNIVLSRKALLEEENAEKKKHTLATLEEGKLLHGVVKNITDYGAFIDLGGIDGLLHVTDMSWGRAAHPSDLFKVADEVDVVVLKFDRTTERVSLGYKQLHADPWTAVDERYQAGQRVDGKVVSLTDYGAFIELEPGVEGLIHVSEMSWSKRVKHPSKLLNVGDAVESMVLGVDPQARRISLGLKQCQGNPWDDFAVTHNKGDHVAGKIKSITDFGVFVDLGGADGLIHISELSWDPVRTPEDVVSLGEELDVYVLRVDSQNKKIALSLRRLQPEPWETITDAFHVGDIVDATVTKLTNFGAFARVEASVEGLIHISELTSRAINHPREVVGEGDAVRLKILRIEPERRRLGLSLKQAEDEEV